LHEINCYYFFIRKKHKLYDAYQFPGFQPDVKIVGIFGNPKARFIILKRRQKGDIKILKITHTVGRRAKKKSYKEKHCLLGDIT
jgi:hypothetical protein